MGDVTVAVPLASATVPVKVFAADSVRLKRVRRRQRCIGVDRRQWRARRSRRRRLTHPNRRASDRVARWPEDDIVSARTLRTYGRCPKCYEAPCGTRDRQIFQRGKSSQPPRSAPKLYHRVFPFAHYSHSDGRRLRGCPAEF